MIKSLDVGNTLQYKAGSYLTKGFVKMVIHIHHMYRVYQQKFARYSNTHMKRTTGWILTYELSNERVGHLTCLWMFWWGSALSIVSSCLYVFPNWIWNLLAMSFVVSSACPASSRFLLYCGGGVLIARIVADHMFSNVPECVGVCSPFLYDLVHFFFYDVLNIFFCN